MFLEFLCVKVGHGMYFLVLNLESRVLPLGTETLTCPVALRTNALELIDAVWNGWEYGESAPRSLGLWWVGVVHRICFKFPWPREYSDIHLFMWGQGQVSGGWTCHSSCLGM